MVFFFVSTIVSTHDCIERGFTKYDVMLKAQDEELIKTNHRTCLTNSCTDEGVQSGISVVLILTGKAKKEYLWPLIFNP